MKCQMIFSQNDFFGHSKIHSGHLTFFIPSNTTPNATQHNDSNKEWDAAATTILKV
jgi:hypothetical protein